MCGGLALGRGMLKNWVYGRMLARACSSFSRTNQIGAKHNRYRHEHPDNTSPIGFGFSLDKFHKKIPILREKTAISTLKFANN
jgi:hypothetical protein